MAQKIRVKLEADKLRKLVKTEEFTNGEGELIKRQVIELDLVEMAERKFRGESDKAKAYKTHFACEISKKDENGEYPETVFVGEGIQFEFKDQKESAPQEDNINAEDIPF